MSDKPKLLNPKTYEDCPATKRQINWVYYNTDMLVDQIAECFGITTYRMLKIVREIDMEDRK